MPMHNPPHPGEFIQVTYLEPFNISGRFLAEKLNVAASTLNRVLKMQSGISPEMALRLAKAFDTRLVLPPPRIARRRSTVVDGTGFSSAILLATL